MRIANLAAALWRAYKNEKGLTAIELAVVAAILAILAGLVATSTTGMSTTARGSSQATDRAEVQKAVDNYVGQHPKSYYPVATGSTAVSCADGSAITPTVTPTDFTKTGLAAALGSNCVPLSVSASFQTPDTPVVTKTFVTDFMQRNPKHVTESPNPWVINASGTVTNVLSAGAY